MELSSWVMIFAVMTSVHVKPVTSQKKSLQCCPVLPYQGGRHVLCADRQFHSFAWSRKALVSYKEKTEELCLNGHKESGGSSVGHTSSSQNVLWLDLSFNSLTSFPDVSHSLFAGVQHLNLSHNKIQGVSGGLLRVVPELQTLDLSWNQLSVVPDFPTAPMPGLTFLDLSHNAVQEVLGASFRGLSRLQTLLVSHCQVRQLGSFFHLPELRVLLLRSNVLESLPLRVFEDLTHLSELDLSGNVLEAFPENAFHGLRELRSLNLSHNKLNDVPPGSLRSLEFLKTLDLSSNRMESISSGLFEDLQTLDHLTLASNEVRAISSDTLKGLKSLQDLNLSHNQLTTIRKASFTHLTKLLRLNLKTNSLKRLHEHVFAGLKWLEHLDLSDNKLQLDFQSLPEEVFSPLHNLRTLLIHDNDVQTHSVHHASVFTHLLNVSHLSLDMVSEATFPQQATAFPRLRKLALPSCKVKSLTEDTFKGLRDSNVEKILMSGCPLHVVEECAFCWLPRLEWLSMTDASSAAPLGIPSRLFSDGSPLRHLNLSGMNLRSDAVQALADHTLKNLDRLQVLDLSRNQLTDQNMTLTGRLKELHLSGNRFQSVPVNLTVLKRLALLDLSDNNISSLTPAERTAMDRLADRSTFNLRLHGNRLPCPRDDCSGRDFWAWLYSSRVRLDDGSLPGGEYPCVTEQGKEWTVAEALGACSSWTTAWVYAVLTAAFCLVIRLVRRRPADGSAVVKPAQSLTLEAEDDTMTEQEAAGRLEYAQLPMSTKEGGHNDDDLLHSMNMGWSDLPTLSSLTVIAASNGDTASTVSTLALSTSESTSGSKSFTASALKEEVEEKTADHGASSRPQPWPGMADSQDMTSATSEARTEEGRTDDVEKKIPMSSGQVSFSSAVSLDQAPNGACSYVRNYNDRRRTDVKLPFNNAEPTESPESFPEQGGNACRSATSLFHPHPLEASAHPRESSFVREHYRQHNTERKMPVSALENVSFAEQTAAPDPDADDVNSDTSLRRRCHAQRSERPLEDRHGPAFNRPQSQGPHLLRKAPQDIGLMNAGGFMNGLPAFQPPSPPCLPPCHEEGPPYMRDLPPPYSTLPQNVTDDERQLRQDQEELRLQ